MDGRPRLAPGQSCNREMIVRGYGNIAAQLRPGLGSAVADCGRHEKVPPYSWTYSSYGRNGWVWEERTIFAFEIGMWPGYKCIRARKHPLHT